MRGVRRRRLVPAGRWSRDGLEQFRLREHAVTATGDGCLSPASAYATLDRCQRRMRWRQWRQGWRQRPEEMLPDDREHVFLRSASGVAAEEETEGPYLGLWAAAYAPPGGCSGGGGRGAGDGTPDD